MNTDNAKRCQQAQHGYWEFESKPSPRSPLPVGEGLEVRVRSLPISDYLWLMCPEFGFWLSGFSYCALWPLCFDSVSLCFPNRDYGVGHGRWTEDSIPWVRPDRLPGVEEDFGMPPTD